MAGNEVVIHVKAEDRASGAMAGIGKKVEVEAKRSFLKAGGHGGAAFMAGFIKTITLGQVGSGFAMAATKLKPQMAHAGGVLGVALAAGIVVKLASAMSALLPAALGGVLVAGPLMYLWKTQEKAVERLKKKAQEFMEVISQPLKIPFEKSLGAVGEGLERLKKPLKALFKDIGGGLAPLVEGAFKGIEGFVGKIAPKAESIKAAFKAWGDNLPRIGEALGEMLGDWVGDADETKASVDDLADSFVDLADAVGGIGKGFRKFNKLNDGFKEVMEGQRATLLKWRIAVLEVLSGVADAWAASPFAPKAAKRWAAHLHESLATSREDLAKTNKAMEKLANKKVVTKLKADKKDSEAKIRDIDRQLKRTNDKKVISKLKADREQAVAAIAAVNARLNALDGKTVFTWIKTIKTTQLGPGSAGRRAAGGNIGAEGWSHAAEGGPRSNRVLVGEQGPEIVDLPLGSHVNSNPDTQRMMATGSKGGGGDTHFHFHGPVYGDHNALRRALVNMKRSGQLDVVLR